MSTPEARPFRLLGDGAMRAVRGALAQAVSAWAGDWGLASARVDVGVQRAWDGAVARTLTWNHSAGTNGRHTWLAVGADFANGLQQSLFPADPGFCPGGNAPAALAAAGARQALDGLLDALVCAALSSRHDVPRATAAVPAAPWRHGSGALVAQITVGGRHCHVLLDDAAVQALAPPAARLPPLPAVDVAAGVADVPVALRLDAGTARVGLGALLSLAPGDVIRLERQTDEPLALNTPSGDPLFHAYLGQRGADVAVELVQSHPHLEKQ
jgi:hypothetical protein